MSKYGVFSGPYLPVLSPNADNYGTEKIPYLNTFHAVIMYSIITDTQLGLELSSILNGTDILQGIFYAIGKIVSLIKTIFITK